MKAPPSPRSPWQKLYSSVHHLRRRRWADQAHRLPVPVISIGNLHWGGSGKTPITAALARHLTAAGRQVAILSRGYRRQGRGVRVVSRGEGLIGTAIEAGDEPAMLAKELEGVSIVVGADRHDAGLAALARLDPKPDILLLDDAFSHVRLWRDLDLLVFPQHDPFAGGKLPPFGRLREPLASAAHASAVILSGLTGSPQGGGDSLAGALQPFGFQGPGFGASLDASLKPPAAADEPVLLVTGTANPQRVVDTAKGLGLVIGRHLAFPDHHAYPAASLKRIEAALSDLGGKTVVTTSKDATKLGERLDCALAELRIEARLEEAFWTWLDQAGSISNSGSPPSTD